MSDIICVSRAERITKCNHVTDKIIENQLISQCSGTQQIK